VDGSIAEASIADTHRGGLMAESKTARRGAPSGFVVVLVTCSSRREAARIANAVVARRLAACVNIVSAPVDSVYRWKGKLEKAREFLLLIKTSRRRLAALRREVEKLHSYDAPEFIALPIAAGSPKYLAWLADCLRRP
jgi:periplasmic divalent cation tolerance protein